jgi:DNA-directed RNA polymerase subunit beta'
LKTSEAGYLTRRLVDISQDLVVTMDDCHTINGIERSAIRDDTGEIVESLADRIVGRCPAEDVRHPFTHEIIAPANVEISDAKAKEIEEAGVEHVLLRTVLTCEAKHGVCRKCYGRNLATNRSVDIAGGGRNRGRPVHRTAWYPADAPHVPQRRCRFGKR